LNLHRALAPPYLRLQPRGLYPRYRSHAIGARGKKQFVVAPTGIEPVIRGPGRSR